MKRALPLGAALAFGAAVSAQPRLTLDHPAIAKRSDVARADARS